MHTLAVTAFLFVLALLFATFEIEAEGKHGWAEKFPTWYRTTGSVARLYMFFTNKPLTGYHSALFFVPVMIFLWPMVATATFTLAGLAQALAYYFAWVIVWDFLWFVLNPHYGIRRFRPKNVWWFDNEPWILGVIPSSYITSWATALALAALSGGIDGGWIDQVGLQLQQFGWYLIGIILAILAAPFFRRYYTNMRTRDDRSNANIFH